MKRAAVLIVAALCGCQSPSPAPPQAPRAEAAPEPSGFMVDDVYFSRGRNSGRPLMTVMTPDGKPVTVPITETAYMRAAKYGEIPDRAAR